MSTPQLRAGGRAGDVPYGIRNTYRYTDFIEKHLTVSHVSAGPEVNVICPFHDDTRPSMYVNAETGLWLCHSCGVKGSIDLLADRLGVSSQGSKIPLDYLSRKLHPDKELNGIKTFPESYLKQFRSRTLHPFWSSRGFTETTVAQFDLGFDPLQRNMTIPLRNEHGQIIGVIRRQLGDQRPRYLYPKGVPIGRFLFGSWLIAKKKLTKVALVEGSLDAVACWDARIPAVAMLGSRLTGDQAQLLKRLGITRYVILTDNDRAGIEAVHQIKHALNGYTVQVGYYRYYWRAKDPGELSPMQRRKLFHSALPYHQWRKISD